MRPGHPLKRAARDTLLVSLSVWGLCPTAQAHEGALGNEIMWQVCEARKTNDRCSFENLNHDVYRGTCQSMSGAMVCVRNQPIEYAVGAQQTTEHEHEHPNETTLTTANTRPAQHTRRQWPWLVGSLVVLIAVLTGFGMRKRSKP